MNFKEYFNDISNLTTKFNLSQRQSINVGNFMKEKILRVINDIAQHVNSNGTEQWDGKISQVMSYNRTLSATEILQNFNHFKYRYGN